MMGDHLIFYWRQNATDHMITLHGWEPFTQVVATLHAIVLSAPGGRNAAKESDFAGPMRSSVAEARWER
jgi:hypothetical protein